MKAFECDGCGNLLFFENVTCLRCERTLGFIPEIVDLTALEPASGDAWQPLSPAIEGKAYRKCANGTQYQTCNWMVAETDDNPLCKACRLNLVIPDLTIAENRERWKKLEVAKRRVIYSLLQFKLSTEEEQGRTPLRFKFMADPAGGPAVLTGHAQGVITINIAEADDAEREKRRVQLHEPFRTLLGHVRHEVAHYYWDRLIAGTDHLDEFRRLFGDEREDYAVALQRHYDVGPAADWYARYVSAYASSHPWEDWAETWAHYLHIVDSLETAGSFGVSLRPSHAQAATMRADPKKLVNDFSDFAAIIRTWLPLTHALNEMNRGMGLPDLYPFVLSEIAVEKLGFIHRVLHP